MASRGYDPEGITAGFALAAIVATIVAVTQFGCFGLVIGAIVLFAIINTGSNMSKW